jgi:hypothetical protein
MTTATAETNTHRIVRRSSDWDLLLIYLLSAAGFVTLISIFGPTIYLVEHQDEKAMDVRVALIDQPNRIVEVDDLKHEELFRKTVKSCLPAENPKCNEFIPEPINAEQKKVQRVAILAPPGEVSMALVNRVEQIVHRHNKLANKGTLDIEIILTSHVPPYGYGKTHGLTKVLRLLPEPLMLEVTGALTAVLEPGESHTEITLADLKAALRMILRFHCRLSHVSAHTAIASIKLMDLLADTSETMRKLQVFLTPNDKPEAQDIVEGEGEEGFAFDFTVDDDQVGLMDAEMAYGSQMLTHVQKLTRGKNVADILDQVLLDELKLTKDMSVWPCPSFWAAGEDDGPLLSDTLRRLAEKLSPDCDDAYNTCFVERDKCEFKSDAACAKKR